MNRDAARHALAMLAGPPPAASAAPTFEERWNELRRATPLFSAATAPDLLQRAYGALANGVVISPAFGPPMVFVQTSADGATYLMSQAVYRELLDGAHRLILEGG